MSKEMIDALANGDNLSAENEFKAAISQKVGDSLERKRVEVASSMLPQDERTPQELAFSKAHDIQYAEVDPHSGQELENDYDVE